jgi:hypothetical protein
VTLPKGKDAFKDVAKVALGQLLTLLDPAKLPAFRPVEKPAEEGKLPQGPKEGDKPAPLEEKAPVVVVREPAGPSGMKIAGGTMVGLGAAAAVAGAVVFATAPVPRTDGSGNVLVDDKDKVGPAKSQQTAGIAVLAAGAGLAAAGAVVWALAPSVPESVKKVSIVPVAGGLFAVVGGSF